MKYAVLLILLAGCAVNSGVVSMGSDTYFISRQAATGLSGTANLKAEAINEANAFCGAQKKTLQVTNLSESQPPYILGNYPKAELQFACR